jgi:hypothetical protein
MTKRMLDAIPDIKALHWPRRDDYTAFSAHDAPQESSLLQLPRELRDMIYSYFLEADRCSPLSPHASGPRVFRVDDRYGTDTPTPIKDIAYPTSIPQTNVEALLKTSRQLRSEVLELAEKRNQHDGCLPAELHLLATGYVFYPYWTRLPMLAGHKPSLDVTVRLRVFSCESFHAPSVAPGMPCFAARQLLTLLNQFATCGPAFTRTRGSRADETAPVIDTLTVRLLNHDTYTARMFPPAVLEVVRMCRGLCQRADVRPFLRRICVVVERKGRCVLDFEEREWEFEVASSCEKGELEELMLTWAEMELEWEADAARFVTGRPVASS